MTLAQEYLELIAKTNLLLQEESCIFACSEDLAFFRQTLPSPKQPPTPIFLKTAVPQRISSPPLPLPLPEEPTPKASLQKAQEELLPPKREPPKADVEKTAFSHQQSPSFFFSLFSKIAPNIPLLKEIPDDALAKQIANRWKTNNQVAPITVLYSAESEAHQKFLQEITRAIDVYFGPARMIHAEPIEKEKQWDVFLSSEHLKWVILCDYTLWQLHHLMQFYKEIPAQGSRLLKNVPLFLLPDLSLYLKDPLLKRSLWKALHRLQKDTDRP